MIHLATAAYFVLFISIFTSSELIQVYQKLITLPIAYFGYKAFKDKSLKQLPKSAYFLIVFAILAYIGLKINTPFLNNPGKSVRRLRYFLVAIGNIYVLRYWLLSVSDSTKKFLLHAFFLGITISACSAVWSYFYAPSIDGRANGLIYIMRYGYGTAMMLIILLGGILHQKETKQWFDWRLGLVVFILAFAGMYLSYTRGALLGFFCGIPFLLYFFNKKYGLIFGGISLAGILIVGALYLFGSGNYGTRFLMNKNNESDKIRRDMWTSALIATKEKPLFGWGYANLRTQIHRIKIENNLYAPNFISHAHNIFLEILAGTGLLGFFAFMGWLISWALEMYKNNGLVKALTIPFGVVFVVSGQFEVTFDSNNTAWILFVYTFSTALNFQRQKTSLS